MAEAAERRIEPNALRRYELLSENTRDVVLFLRPDGSIVEANRAAVAAYGYSRAELLGMNVAALRAGDPADETGRQLTIAQKGGLTFETMHRRKDGTTFPVEISSTPTEFGGMLLSLVRDITQRKRRELTQALLLEIAQRILRRHPTREILPTICDRLAHIFGYTLVWVGAKRPGGEVSILAQAGPSASFLEGACVRWDDSPQGAGPTGTAIRTGEPQTSRVPEPRWDFWRDRAEEYGLQASLSLPLIAAGETLGALTLYATTGNAFDDETVSQLFAFATQVAISLQAARDQEQIRLQTAALEATDNGMVITGRDGKILWANPGWTRLTGYTADEVIGQSPRLLKSGNQSPQFYRVMWETILAGQTWRGELFNRRKDGSLYAEEMTITPVRSEAGEITHFVAVKQDVTERRQQEERLRYLALHDPVTELPNRRALRDTLEVLVSRSRRGRPGALLFLDMDNFKLINDTRGHATGDAILIGLAQLMRGPLRSFDTLARWGGDEFAVLLEDLSLDEAVEVAELLRQVVTTANHHLGDLDLHLSASIGIAPIDGQHDPDAVMALADQALYAAKEGGKNRVAVCRSTEEAGARLAEAGRWAARIKSALEQDRLTLHFQPVVTLADGSVDHYEALVRLVDEDKHLAYPPAFMAAAERFGLMPEIDRWVVNRVLTLMTEQPSLHVSVNLSGSSLGDEALLTYMEERVRASGDAAGRLGFEITESAVVRDLAAAQRWMHRLKGLGCRFALDDFGAGFASFAYLQALPVDVVKIAGTFMHNLDSDPTNRSMVQAIKMVAHALGKAAIAEWVESEPVARLLQDLEVEYGQGARWGMPSDRLG
jgi:diguanylate cyclase (GGDEF)-like protein/PAS domain S-box-containing protein